MFLRRGWAWTGRPLDPKRWPMTKSPLRRTAHLNINQRCRSVKASPSSSSTAPGDATNTGSDGKQSSCFHSRCFLLTTSILASCWDKKNSRWGHNHPSIPPIHQFYVARFLFAIVVTWGHRDSPSGLHPGTGYRSVSGQPHLGPVTNQLNVGGGFHLVGMWRNLHPGPVEKSVLLGVKLVIDPRKLETWEEIRRDCWGALIQQCSANGDVRTFKQGVWLAVDGSVLLHHCLSRGVCQSHQIRSSGGILAKPFMCYLRHLETWSLGSAALTVPCWRSEGRQTSCKLVGRISGWTGRSCLCPVWHSWCRTCRRGCCRCRLSGHTPSAHHPRMRWCGGKLPKRPHRNGWRQPSLSICWWCERRSGTEKVGLIPYCWSHIYATESAMLINRNPACLKRLLSCVDHKLWWYFTYCRHGNVQPH